MKRMISNLRDNMAYIRVTDYNIIMNIIVITWLNIFIVSYHNSCPVSLILENILKKLAGHDCVVYGISLNSTWIDLYFLLGNFSSCIFMLRQFLSYENVISNT